MSCIDGKESRYESKVKREQNVNRWEPEIKELDGVRAWKAMIRTQDFKLNTQLRI